MTFLRSVYGGDAELEIIIDETTEGGFRLHVGSDVYDWSHEGRLEQLRRKLSELKVSGEGIIPLIRQRVDELFLDSRAEHVGHVATVGDSIATVKGLPGAFYGEILVFESGVRGMVQELRRDEVGVVVFGVDGDVSSGDRVTSTGKTAGVPVGEDFLGRVVDCLGSPVDGGPEIRPSGYLPLEARAPEIVERQSVSVPLETGILAIDAMFPIGRGQRELIIGDRQTGKSAMAIDAILNQKGKNVACIYVAIGQKASSVARTVETLRARGALDYTTIVHSPASDPASMQYIAPYAGCAMAEYLMRKGRDVLIVYDDLSKHAVAYRAVSLLLERPPGREAFPGDVFYLHSRLLERAARLSDELGGGSMTALPIVETLSGDVSAYIPTNIISITDGQIFLESDLFFAGQRPAINIGLSVSRVGGAAQTQALRSAAGAIRLELAQYREMEIFTQFASDLDESTKQLLIYGQRLMQLLKQEQYRSMSLHEQVITLVAATSHVMFEVPTARIKFFHADLIWYFETTQQELCSKIDRDKTLDNDMRTNILDITRYFKDNRIRRRNLGIAGRSKRQ
jgi:F-type H+-transporting ATPase subunit alpha